MRASSRPSSLAEAVEAIRRETLRGAAWSARIAVEGLLAELESGVDVCERAGEAAGLIEAANPSMASLANVALLVREACERGGEAALARALREMLYYMDEARRRIRVAAMEVFPRGTRVAAFSYSSNVEGVLVDARRFLAHVIVFESRPGGEGLALARSLRQLGVSVTLAPDALMHLYLPTVDMALVGADTVTRDGCLVNKAGTRLLAQAAREAGVPLVTVFEAYKVHPRRGCGEVPIARRVYDVEGWGPEDYPVFDETPSTLVAAAITEAGVAKWSPELPPRLHSRWLNAVLGQG